MTATAYIDAAGHAAAATPTAPGTLDPERILAVHRALLNDRSIQFALPHKAAEVSDPPPRWLEGLVKAIGRFIEWVGGGWSVLMWGMLALLAIVLLLAFFPGARAWIAERIARLRGTATAEPEWAPAADTARALLDEADALAANGSYDAAVRLILFRSIEDIAAWRGDIVRPSLTSRDIARADALPGAARSVFAAIVAAVERSLFGGAALGRDDWERARGDYARFALGGA